MILCHEDFETVFEIIPGRINVLIVENEGLFYKYCLELHQQVEGEDGRFCLSEGDKKIPLCKHALLIDSYLDFNFNEKKILSKLTQQLKASVNEKYYSEVTEIAQLWGALFEKFSLESCCNLEYSTDDTLSLLFKGFDIKIDMDSFDSLLDEILSYMRVWSDVMGIKCFFFINLKSYLTPQELGLFYHECSLNEYCIILFENQHKSSIEGEKILLIDQDLCEIPIITN
ncbi:MAG: type II-A CRISPR-associated protein Csn2 [Clostridia bacterium]|nr:type II-A CRISPR-associated protein Csn2 [Clostridia bacterium]